MSEWEPLLPCPCCGARAELQDADMPGYEGGQFIECSGCRLTTPVRFSCKEDARPLLAEAWNRRILPPASPPREWLVIESSVKHAVFAPDEEQKRKGYIPRDVAERLLGRNLGDVVWFTREDSKKLREHREWRDTVPPGRDASPAPNVDAMERATSFMNMLRERSNRAECPWHFTTSELASVITAAVEAEREACAQIAFKIADDDLPELGFVNRSGSRQRALWASVCDRITGHIRARGEKAT
jgi:hypothetical protein